MSYVGPMTGSTDSPPDLCISHLIETQATRAPEAIAIAAPSRTPLTYKRLNRQIDDTVKKLNGMGVGRRDCVALALPNGPEMAAAFLAVAAGATCAPLNPAYQVKEYDFFLSDLNPMAVILWSGMDSPARVVARERDIPIIELSPVLEAEAGVFALAGDVRSRPVASGFTQSDDVALVLHTSGTTSRPKIISLTHRNICTSAHNIRRALELVRSDRCLNVMPLFHIHGLVGAVLSTLAADASVVCAPGFYAPKFFAWMEEFRPTWYTAVPTMHQAILARAAFNPGVIAHCPLRFIRSSSSRLPPQVMMELENVFHAPVIEAYGMTEASHQIASNPLPPRQRKAGSVGLAVGSELAVVDDAGQFLRPEEVGEIVIRGANITQSYENDSTLNENAFTEGWLRTGDQGYLDSDGYLFITGRLKEVINRGGEKISPHEVDEALMNHPAIAQAVTFPVPDSKLGEDIAAAVVLHENTSASESEIQEFAAARLADFKVPRRVIVVDEIPQGPTGKLQRAGLAEKLGLRASEGPDVKAAYTAPRTPLEEKLSEIWSEILGLRRVGVDDNFFQLGGDSLLATQVISRVRDALHAELSFIGFFETPTVASLAAAVARSQAENAQRQKIAHRSTELKGGSDRSCEQSISRRKNRDRAPLSFAQERLWFLDQMEPGSPAYNRPANFRLFGRLDVKALELSLSEIVTRHEILRTRFAVESGKPVQVICPARALSLSLVDLSERSAPERESQAQALAAEEAQLPFDLGQGPLMRSTLLRLGEEDHVLLLTIHHIAFDGWSLSVLARELTAHYQAFCAGHPQPLPELSIQYADYAHWQRQWLQGDVLQTQLSYWKQQLDCVPVLDLLTDRPRPQVQTFRGAKQSLVLSSRLTEELKRLSLREGVTPFMTLLAAFTTLLRGYTGQDDIALGTFIINRNLAETEGLIGFFINNLVLRTDLSGDPSFRDLLIRVRTVALTAYAHQDLPFETLLEQLRPERYRNRTPLFQVMLVLQNTPGSALELAGLTSSSYPVAQSTRSNFDLTLWMSDGIEGLTGILEYNADLFEATSMIRMLENFQFLLEAIVADPDQHLSTLSISLDRERRRRSARGNDAEAISPVDAQVAQVDRYANPVADTAERQAQLSQRRARLSAAKRALLEKRLLGEWAGSTKIIHRRPDNGPAPLSYAQQRLWFLDQLMPGSAYNSPGAFRIESAIDIALAERIVNEIVRRHEILRTTFQSIEGQPFQVVAPVLTVPVVVVDLSNLSEPKREAEVRRLATEEAQRPFDLAQGPLLRVTLLRLGDHEHVFLVTMHHIISDGWSIGVFIREAVALYGALSNGAPSPLAELPIQYADFAVWQREWLQGEVLEGQLGYWRQQLADISVLQLPTDHPRPAVQTSRGKRQSVALPKALSEALKALSRQEGTTLFMTLLAAFKILLHRYTGQDDLAVGTPIANRNRLEIDGLIGFFVNTLVLRTDLAGNPSFRELLRRVREVCLGAYARQDLPFERLVEELHLERDMSRNPLFQVMFVLENISLRAAELPGLTLSPIEADSETALFDLTLQVMDTKQGLTAAFVYNTDLFEAATVARMLDHFQILLEAIVADPEQRLSDLPLLTKAERQQLLMEWNDNKTDYPQDLCIHQLFEAQVERTPDAIAVVFEHEQLTYEELNRRSNRLAHHLRALGVGPEVLVGVCLERSLEMVIGLLAILKAGGAYVPVDPAYPNERLAFMLKDAQAPVLLTLERSVAELVEHRGLKIGDLDSPSPIVNSHIQIICLDSDWGAIASESGENPINLTTPENLAYVIYTSGSTGQPKGVLVSHGSIADYCRTAQRYYELDAADAVLQFASLSFDVSLEEILPTLMVGARLVVMGTTVWRPAEFHSKISQFGLTVLTFPTAYWQELARQWANAPELVPNIQPRLFIVGGDTMSPEGLNLWQRTPVNSVRLLNVYGPTEATITATAWEFSPRFCENRTFQRIPIGRPLANREIYILDKYGNPVSIGVCGELHIDGAGLARGYLNRPELTAEKFIPNPFSEEPGAHLYKTGDLARYLPDGNIEFLGRVDHQVKIRGFRIELGEIESALDRHPAVREAVVLAREDKPEEKRLVAYVVATQESRPTANDLRSFLKKKLPEHMVPALFVLLDALPLMPNGKVDRLALPAPDRTRPELEKVFVAPRDDLELQLTQIWEEVLGVRPVGVRDNFFELGGHSLLAARLFASIESRLGKKLPLATVFQGATVEHLAGILRQDAKPAPRSSLVAIQPGGSKRPLFLVHPAGGHVFPYVHLARYLGPDQPCYGLQARGLEEGEEAHTRIEDMAADYIKALRTVQPEGPYLLGGWSMGGLVAFEMAQQLHAQAEGVDLLALLDTRMTPPDEKDSEADFDAMLLADFVRYFGLSLDLWESLAQLPKDEVLTHVLELAQRAGLVPPEVEVSQAHRFVELLKSDFQATRNYELHRYPGRVTLFKASEELAGTSPDPTLGWSQWTVEEVEVHVVAGNHANMVYQPHVEGLAEKLRDCLNHAQSADHRLTLSLSTDPLIKEAQ